MQKKMQKKIEKSLRSQYRREALAEGERLASLNIAKKLKEKGYESSEIVNITGLTEEEIEKI